MEFAAISSALTLTVFLRKYLRKTYFYNGSVLDGVLMPPFQTEERHDKVCDALTSKDKGALDDETDVWIATYPKCGTTWMQQIVLELTRLKSEGDEPLNYKDSPWVRRALFRFEDTLSINLRQTRQHTITARSNALLNTRRPGIQRSNDGRICEL